MQTYICIQDIIDKKVILNLLYTVPKPNDWKSLKTPELSIKQGQMCYYWRNISRQLSEMLILWIQFLFFITSAEQFNNPEDKPSLSGYVTSAANWNPTGRNPVIKNLQIQISNYLSWCVQLAFLHKTISVSCERGQFVLVISFDLLRRKLHLNLY